MANPFDQFADAPVASSNPFDAFGDPPKAAAPAASEHVDFGPADPDGALAIAGNDNSDEGSAGAFVRGAERRALPAAGGVVGAGAGAALGGTGGAALGALTGPLAPIAIPALGTIGGVGGGLAGAFAGATAVGKAQEWVLDHAPDRVVKALGLDKEQQAKDQAEHPIASFAGELAPNLLAFRPGSLEAAREGAGTVERLMAHPVTARALPATIMGAQEVAAEKLDGQDIDPTKVAIASAVGAASNKMTKLGHFLTGSGVGPVIGLQAALRNRGKGAEPDFGGMRDITPEKPGPAPAGTPQLEAPIDPQDIHPGDEESPIPTSIIAEGRRQIREATDQTAQEPDIAPILTRNGWPQHGSRVTLNDGEGPAATGVVHGAYNTLHPELGVPADALMVRLDSGHMFTAFKHEIDAAGIAITPEQAQQAGLPLDIATQPSAAGQPPAATAEQAPAAAPVAETGTPPQDASQPPVIQPMPVDLFQPARVSTPAVAPVTTGDGTQAAPIVVTHPDHVEQASELVNTAPSEAQAEAGNYKKLHLKVQGLPITIENPKGSVRRGVDADGKPWEVALPASYGYIKRSTAADGEQVDVYVGPNPQSSRVFVVDQKDAKTGAYDEAKSFIGFDTKEQALTTYHAAFSDGLGQQRMGGIREMNTLQFKKLLNSGVLDKPVAGGLQQTPQIGNSPSAVAVKATEQQPATPIVKTARPALAPSRETSVLENIRRMGGIKTVDGLGRPTKEGQDISAVLKDVNRPGLINNKTGQPADTIRERLKEQGWFGGSPEHGTDIQHLYDLIDKEVRGGPQFHPESDRGRAVTERAVTDDNARVLAEVHAEAKKGGGKPLTHEEAEQIVVNMGAHGINAEDAVADFIENKALREQYEDDAKEVAHAPAAPESVNRGTSEADRAHGQGGEEPAPASSDANGAPGGSLATPGDTGQTHLATERDAEGLNQTIVPGAEKSAQQLAKAREASGHGRTTTSVARKDAGGLFAPKVEETADMFAWPKAETPVPPTAPKASDTGKIEDFGDVLTGARKHYAEAYRDKMADAGKVDIATEPLSKSWPEPDYEKMIELGTDPWTVGFIHSARDEIPTKPQRAWKLKGYVESVKALREFSNSLLNGTITKETLLEKLNEPTFQNLKTTLQGRIDLYDAVGHSYSLKGVKLTAGSYSVYAGVSYKPHKIVWTVDQPQKASAFSNMPRELGKGDTRADAIADFKSKISALSEDPKGREVRFDIYRRPGKPEFIIGKKIGKSYVDLKTFADGKAARAYLVSNKDDLIAALARRKYIPNERKESNSPRVGSDHRNGSDVTPDKFNEAFGFRGVQFGNYVEGGRRQEDLNEAYDALMDMAGILDVPARAISLNGELGLAFGARGTGGIHAGAAHYEPGTVVINLTKRSGAGSLAHEWWHAMDNYFSRARGDKGEYLTEKPYERGEGVRPEMVMAFRGVAEAIKASGIPKRSQELDNRRSSPYWATGREMSARSFESYIIARLQDQSASNDYLANIVSKDFWDAQEALGIGQTDGSAESYPYPTVDEAPAIRGAFDHLFQTIETRDGENGERPLFQPSANQESIVGGAKYELDAPQSPENTAKREAMAKTLRAELDRIGLHDVGLKISDSLAPKIDGVQQGKINASYWKGIITAAFDTDDSAASSLHHEEIHAIRDFGLFSKSEWSMLEAKAKSTWRAAHDVDKRWPHLAGNEDKLNEEAIAEAYRAHRKEGAKGLIGRIFDKLRDFLAAVARGLHGLGFGTEGRDIRTDAEHIFGKIDSGEVGARPRTELPYRGVEHEPSFMPADEHQAAFDQAWDATIAASAKKLGWEGEPTSQAMFAKALLTPKGPAKTELYRNAGLIKTMEEQRTTPFKAPVTPITGTGETKTRGLSAGIEAKAVEKKLTDSFGPLPEYRTVNMKDQAARAAKFLEQDYEAAKAVAMGEEPAPFGVLPESILVAVENRAIKEGDTETLRQLATNSSLNIEATTMGQRIRTLGERDPTSPVAAIKAVNDARQAAAKAKGVDPKRAKGNAVKDMLAAIKKETDKSAKRVTWETFLHSITCDASGKPK